MEVTRASIAIVDSNRLFRAGLISLLNDAAGHPVGEAANVEDLRGLIAEGRQFDLILLEARKGPPENPCPVTDVRALLPAARITVLAEKFDTGQLRACFAAGADGYLLKDISHQTLQASLNLILLGEKILPTPLAEMLAQEGLLPLNGAGAENGFTIIADDHAGGISEREMEILRCLVNGDSNKRIANRLSIAEATVKVHLKSILRKTHAANRTQAAIWALHRGVSGMAAAAILALGEPDLQALIGDVHQLAIV